VSVQRLRRLALSAAGSLTAVWMGMKAFEVDASDDAAVIAKTKVAFRFFILMSDDCVVSSVAVSVAVAVAVAVAGNGDGDGDG